MAFRPVGPPPDQRPPGLGRRLLGGPDSWRRVLLAGLGGGLALAAAAAFAMAIVDDESGALDEGTPTPTAPLAAPVEDAGEVAPPADDQPVRDAPTIEEPPPVEEPPTEPPPTVAEPPTEAPPLTEPAETPLVEEPTAEPTPAEGGGGG